MCKLGVINQLRAGQDKGKAPLGATPEMRVVGVDADAADLLLRLLAADPAARPTARQVRCAVRAVHGVRYALCALVFGSIVVTLPTYVLTD